jgi:hypothetical protein
MKNSKSFSMLLREKILSIDDFADIIGKSISQKVKEGMENIIAKEVSKNTPVDPHKDEEIMEKIKNVITSLSEPEWEKEPIWEEKSKKECTNNKRASGYMRKKEEDAKNEEKIRKDEFKKKIKKYRILRNVAIFYLKKEGVPDEKISSFFHITENLVYRCNKDMEKIMEGTMKDDSSSYIGIKLNKIKLNGENGKDIAKSLAEKVEEKLNSFKKIIQKQFESL